MDEVCFLSYQPSINFCLPQISHKSKQIRHIKKKKKQKNKQKNPLTDQSKAMTFHLVTSEFKKIIPFGPAHTAQGKTFRQF